MINAFQGVDIKKLSFECILKEFLKFCLLINRFSFYKTEDTLKFLQRFTNTHKVALKCSIF